MRSEQPRSLAERFPRSRRKSPYRFNQRRLRRQSTRPPKRASTPRLRRRRMRKSTPRRKPPRSTRLKRKKSRRPKPSLSRKRISNGYQALSSDQAAHQHRGGSRRERDAAYRGIRGRFGRHQDGNQGSSTASF